MEKELRKILSYVNRQFERLDGLKVNADGSTNIEYTTGSFKIGNVQAGNYLEIEADSYTGDAHAVNLDAYIEIDTIGSRERYSK